MLFNLTKISLTLYSIVSATIVTIVVMYLYYKLSLSAKEKEKRRLEASREAQKKLLKIKNLGWSDKLKDEKYGWGLSFKEYLLISGSALFIMVLVGIALKNIFIAIGGGLIAYMFPRYVIKRNRKRVYKLKTKLLKPALQAIASSHTFQPNIISAIQHAVPSIQQPLRRDFELFLMDVEMSVPLYVALNSLRKRVNSKYLDFFIKVVFMAEEEGGRTHELIQTCAEIIDQDMLVMEEFETEIASQRKEANLLLILQFVMLGFLSVTQPDAFKAFTGNILGQIFMLYLLFATFIAYQLIEKFTDASLEEVSTVDV